MDVIQFERLAKAGKLDEAAAIYRGPLLDGHGVRDSAFEDWILVERTRLHDLAVDLLNRFAVSQSDDAAIATAQRLLQLDPGREETHRLLMRLYAAAGQRAQALRQYEHCRDILQRDLQAKPDTETERLHRQIHSETLPAPETRASVAKADQEFPKDVKPSIAVLPFANLSGDPAQEYFSDGITEDIITELSRFRSLFVIARNSSFQYRAQAVDVRRVARELGVGYVVEGSVRTVGDRLRISAQLIDAATGSHVWAERYDRDLNDVLAVQTETAQAIAAVAGARTDHAERTRAMRLDSSDLRAYHHHLRGRELLHRYRRDTNQRAQVELEAAIRLDPSLAEAHADLSSVHVNNRMLGWVADRAGALATGFALARQAVDLDERSARCRRALALAHLFRREFEDAGLHYEIGIDLNPNDARQRAMYGFYLTAVGRIDEALQQFGIMARYDPRDELYFPWVRGIALFSARRYEEAIASLKQVTNPGSEVRGWLVASLAQAGRIKEATAALADYLSFAESDMAVFPGRRLGDWTDFWHGAIEYRDPKDFDHLFDALSKAGLPP